MIAERPELSAEEAWTELVVQVGEAEDAGGIVTSLTGIAWRTLDASAILDAPAPVDGVRPEVIHAVLTAWVAGLPLESRAVLDTDGLDAPNGWAMGSVCVHQGTRVELPINSGTVLNSDVDTIKAVAWWYDHGHDDGLGFDKIDLELRYGSTPLGPFYLGGLSATDDSRQRVFEDSGVGSLSWRLVLEGRDVTSDDEGCLLNGNRVYYAWLYEDADRDDDTDLSTYVRVEIP